MARYTVQLNEQANDKYNELLKLAQDKLGESSLRRPALLEKMMKVYEEYLYNL